MTTSLVYDPVMEHPPRFLEHGLPRLESMTADDLNALPEDPWWKYELLGGAMVLTSDSRSFTWVDLQTFPDDPNWKYELLEGALIVSPNAPGLPHQACVGSLYRLLWGACPPDLQVVIAPFDYQPEDETATQPDVLIARRPVEQKRLTRTPVLVVEVLSRSTRTMDRGAKQRTYEARGVEHYWIVDPDGPSIEALRLVDDKYVSVAKADAGQVFTVREPVPVSFNPRDLSDE
jgi:Uma2 family endonuclease